MNNLIVRIDPIICADMFLAAEICPVEISGLAKVIRKGNEFIIFGEPMIPPQKCSGNGTETDFDPVAYGLWENEMVRSGQAQEVVEFRVWWHSHAWSGVGFSLKDEGTIRQFGDFTGETWVFVVVNKRGDIIVRVNLCENNKLRPVYINKICFSVPTTKESLQKIKEERKERMKAIVDSTVTITSREYVIRRNIDD